MTTPNRISRLLQSTETEAEIPQSEADVWSRLHQGVPYPSDGLHAFRNRDHSPTLGRWVNADPVEYVESESLYPFPEK